ncbi:acyl-coenzyme A diphosphatase FITM2-like [Corticium candelabrum]|uniref:acyl-coenzyme A diphosphatase FITM2-like n=1 Tax=Corticium candelabrum TaxID=121492 RepID=UPI002E264C62|nr:acyl-coenzyme A diphosphatase FITM2-like [Corticium candelabrum]
MDLMGESETHGDRRRETKEKKRKKKKRNEKSKQHADHNPSSTDHFPSSTDKLMELLKMKEPIFLFAIVIFFSLFRSLGVNIIDAVSSPEVSEFLGNKKNILNRIIVTGGWAWTLAFVSINAFVMVILSRQGRWRQLVDAFVRLFVATAVWWILTSLFEYIEFLTGSCSDESVGEVIACKRGGLQWIGFDISGHTFLLMFCVLVVRMEQLNHFHSLSLGCQLWQVFLVSIMSYLSFVLLVVYTFMLVVTSSYFHVFWHKAFGAMFAWLGWLFVYLLANRLRYLTANIAYIRDL